MTTLEMPGISISHTEISNISKHGIWLISKDKEYFMSYEDFPWFKNARVNQIFNLEEPSPGHLYWPDLDVDLALESIENPERFPMKVVQSKEDVLRLLQGCNQKLLDFGVQKCGIFGSFARNRGIHGESDVDILVTFDPERKTFDNFMQLSFFLEDLFGRTVDLVTLESLSPSVSPHILAEVEYVFGNS